VRAHTQHNAILCRYSEPTFFLTFFVVHVAGLNFFSAMIWHSDFVRKLPFLLFVACIFQKDIQRHPLSACARRYAVYALGFVGIVMLLHTRSLFITLVAVINILGAFCLGYYAYREMTGW
jgi:hypothetical protein